MAPGFRKGSKRKNCSCKDTDVRKWTLPSRHASAWRRPLREIAVSAPSGLLLFLEYQLQVKIWNSTPRGSTRMKQFESFALDTSNECLWHEGVQIALASKPFSVLRYLVDNPGRLITHDELLDALWPETYVQPQILRTYVLELRKLLNDDAREPRFIQTVPKRGYSFVATVKERSAPALSADEVASIGTAAAKLVGRDEEILDLQTIALQAAAGQRRVVFITGEAGIGKTSLANALRHAHYGPAWLEDIAWRGSARREPYYAVLEALSHCFTSDHGEKPAAGTARLRTSQDRPSELCEALEELAQEKLFILVIEDIQWAHQSTLELVSALARRSTPPNCW